VGDRLYAGLRRGELMALRWEDIDLKAGVLRVERAWDPIARTFIEPKSRAGRRTVPIASALKGLLLEHRLRCGRSAGLVFGSGETPFDDRRVTERARKVWAASELQPIGLHEARHTFASLMIAAASTRRSSRRTSDTRASRSRTTATDT
jgi:integrase